MLRIRHICSRSVIRPGRKPTRSSWTSRPSMLVTCSSCWSLFTSSTSRSTLSVSRVFYKLMMDRLISMLFSTEEEELYILDGMGYFMYFMSACTVITLLFENVPYGRYATSKYGFPVNVKFAWFVQELPAFLLPLCLVLWTSAAKTSVLPNQLLMAMYFCHYVQR